MAFGFVLILILATLAAAIGLGKVTETESFGLMPIVMAIGNIGTQWASWAFHVKPPAVQPPAAAPEGVGANGTIA